MKILKILKKLNKKSGSAILLVVLTMVAISIYSTSTYVEQEHLLILQKKYEDDIIKRYENDTQNIDEIYNYNQNLY